MSNPCFRIFRNSLITLFVGHLVCLPVSAQASKDNLESTLTPAGTIDPALATLPEIQELFDSGELTSEELVRQSLARIEAYDAKGPALNAMITLNDRALAEARALDAERRDSGPRGPLHGVPVILKDNYDTADLPTTGGSQILKFSRPADGLTSVSAIPPSWAGRRCRSCP